MTEPLGLLEECAELARRLREDKFKNRIYGLMRGNLRADVRPGNRRSGEQPLPASDYTDRQLRGFLDAYNDHKAVARAALMLGQHKRALRELHECLRLERIVIPTEHMTMDELREYVKALRREAEDEVAPKGLPCGNPNCTAVTYESKDRRGGFCRKCARFVTKYGYHRPAELCARDIERQLAKEAK